MTININEVPIGNCLVGKTVGRASRWCDRIGQFPNISLNPEVVDKILNRHELSKVCGVCLERRCGFNKPKQALMITYQKSSLRIG